MSDNVHDKNVNNQQKNVDNAVKNEQIPPHEIIPFPSDVSLNSNMSHKQLKSAHTLLKNSQAEKYEIKCLCSFTSSQYDDHIQHYKRLLREADQALVSRDSLIVILEEQLKKIENLYKKSLDDTQNFRFKYCITSKECGNLQKICEKYRGDIAVLTNAKDKCSSDCSNEEIINVQKEVDNWKSQYKELWKKIEIMGKDLIAQRDTTSKDIQVEFPENHNLRDDLDVLKDHYAKIEKALYTQNEKLEFFVKQLQKDLQNSEQDREHLRKMLFSFQDKLITNTTQDSTHAASLAKILNENEILKEQVKDLKAENELTVNQKVSLLLNNQDLDSADLQIQDLKSEIQFLKIELQTLHEKNIQLQMEVNKNEAPEKDNQTPSQELSNQPSQNSLPPSNILANDSIIEILKQENSDLRTEITSLKQLDNYNECICSTKTDNIKTPKIKQVLKARRDSRVGFIVPHDTGVELIEVNEKEQQHHDTDLVDKLSVEIIHLRRQLKQEEEEEKYLSIECKTALEKKDDVIQELICRNELLKQDYEELLHKSSTNAIPLEANTNEISNKSIVLSLQDEIEQLKIQLNTAHQNYEQVLQENNKLTNELNTKTAQLNENKLTIHDLEENINKLQIMIAAVKEENAKYIQERHCYEEAQNKLSRLEIEVNEIPLVTQKLKHDNELLAAEIDEMNQTLQQYKEESEFKKMENEKLVKNEQHLQCFLSRLMEESAHNTKEYQEKLENNKQAVISLTEECNNLKTSSQNGINLSNNEKQELLNQLYSKDEEIEKLNDKIEKMTKELENEKFLNQKTETTNDRCLSEISWLFKTKENEILTIGTELQDHENNLERLKEENNALRRLLDKKRDLFKADEKLLLKVICEKENEKQKQLELSQNIEQANEIQILNEKYGNEKLKNSEYSNFVNSMSKELLDLKMELYKLLQNLECKLSQLKEDIKNNKYCAIGSTHAVNEMVDQIEIFNKFILQQNTFSASHQEVSSSKNSSSRAFTCIPKCCKVGSEQNTEELLLKREYFIKKIKSIDQKLRTCLDCHSPTKTSETPLDTKPIPNAVDVNELCFQRKYCSESIDCIDKILQINKGFDEKYQENDLASCTVDSSALENVQQTLSNSSEIKLILEEKHNSEECHSIVKDIINDLQEQVKATFSVSEQINELENQLNTQSFMCDTSCYSLALPSLDKDAIQLQEEEQNNEIPDVEKLSKTNKPEDSVKADTQYVLEMENLMHPCNQCPLQLEKENEMPEIEKDAKRNTSINSVKPETGHFLETQTLIQSYKQGSLSQPQKDEQTDKIPEVKKITERNKTEEILESNPQCFLKTEKLMQPHFQDAVEAQKENKLSEAVKSPENIKLEKCKCVRTPTQTENVGHPEQQRQGLALKQCRANTEIKRSEKMKVVATGIPIFVQKTQITTKCAGCQTIAIKCKPRWKNVYVQQYYDSRTSQKICGKHKDEQPKTPATQWPCCSCKSFVRPLNTQLLHTGNKSETVKCACSCQTKMKNVR